MKSLELYKAQLKILTTSSLVATRLRREGWIFKVSKGDRGYCRYRAKLITIPRHALNRGGDYLTYYLHHEMAHALLAELRLSNLIEPHGPEFMAKLIEICPPHCLHYEVGYKPRNAVAAGISSKQLAKIEEIDDTDYCEDLFNL